MDLYTYLFEQYGYDEPIFLEYLLEDLDIKTKRKNRDVTHSCFELMLLFNLFI
jgi:hypothetical protein